MFRKYRFIVEGLSALSNQALNGEGTGSGG